MTRGPLALLARTLFVLGAVAHPAYRCFKISRIAWATASPDAGAPASLAAALACPANSKAWTQEIKRLVVAAMLLTTELVTDTLFYWLPLYVELKLLLAIWLAIPQARLAVVLYDTYAHAALCANEETIDRALLMMADDFAEWATRTVTSISLFARDFVFLILRHGQDAAAVAQKKPSSSLSPPNQPTIQKPIIAPPSPPASPGDKGYSVFGNLFRRSISFVSSSPPEDLGKTKPGQKD